MTIRNESPRVYPSLSRLVGDSQKLAPRGIVAREVANIIASAEQNADDTVLIEKAATLAEWDGLFTGTISSILACGSHNPRTVAWFARRGISA